MITALTIAAYVLFYVVLRGVWLYDLRMQHLRQMADHNRRHYCSYAQIQYEGITPVWIVPVMGDIVIFIYYMMRASKPFATLAKRFKSKIFI